MTFYPNQPTPLDINHHRYCRERKFPPYRHIPGFTPHPVKDPRGHSYKKEHKRSCNTTTLVLPPEKWQNNQQYLYGVDLFNFSYWWEAHEAWEEDWCKSKGNHKKFLQGLIQICAAMIKQHVCQWRGVKKLSVRGCARLSEVESNHPFYMGISLASLLHRLDLFFRNIIDHGQYNKPIDSSLLTPLPLIQLVFPKNVKQPTDTNHH